MKSNAIQFLETQIKFNNNVINKNIDGISNDESMVFPNGGANCMNWVLGHLLYLRNAFIQVLGGKPIWNEGEYSFYNRGAKPLEHQTEFPDFDFLKSSLKQSQAELSRIFNDLEEIDAKSIEDLAGLSLHEIYHAGQLGYIRRLLGKEGAIK